MTTEQSSRSQRRLLTGPNMTLLIFLGVAGFFLWTEHRAHLLGVLPWAFLLGCVFMHLFMHRGHGHGDHERSDRERS